MHATLITHVLRVDGMTEYKRLDKQLQSFWDLESVGIVESNEPHNRMGDILHPSMERMLFVIAYKL